MENLQNEAQTRCCPLLQTTSAYSTDFWNDSCSIAELSDAITYGATGATTNPVIVSEVLKKEFSFWKPRIIELIAEMPCGSQEDIAWKIIEEMGVKAADLLMPVFIRENGRKGRLSIQTNPANYRCSEKMVEQAAHFHSLAPNIQVKLPATQAGITAIEEATYRGININATVSFTVPQAIAVAEAVARGLQRRQAEGRQTDNIYPVCTLMVGRLDDWLKVVADKENIIVDPHCLDWAGVAVMKKAYAIYQERGYKTRLLSAAYRNHLHWSQFIGGDVILTIPYKWQQRFNQSDIEVTARMDTPVSQEILSELDQHFADFRRAYDLNGMETEAFDSFGATVRTLRSFIGSYVDLTAAIRDIMLPNPDK